MKPGKLPDIVLLDANPLEDIANAMTIWRVVAGGRVFAELAASRPSGAGPRD